MAIKKKSISHVLLGLLFCTTATFTPYAHALKSLRLPFKLSEQELKIEDLNHGIKNGIRLSATATIGYHMILKSLIGMTKIWFDYPVQDEITASLSMNTANFDPINNPEDKVSALLTYTISTVIGGIISNFLYQGEYKKSPIGLFLSCLILSSYLPDMHTNPTGE